MLTYNKTNGAVLDMIFPEFVVTEETNPDECTEHIYPEEEAFIQKAAAKRKADFISGRLCSQRALARLGIDRFPILMADDRSPVWPDGFVGSISHTRGYCGVAVASNIDVRSLGLDVERVSRLNRNCWRLVCTGAERKWLNSLPETQRQNIASLVFSAKECFYKCQYTITKSLAGFHDAIISADTKHNNGEFTIRLLRDIAPGFTNGTTLKGQYVFRNEFVFSGMTLRK